MSEVAITEDMVQSFREKLEIYVPKKWQTVSLLDVPTFHVTTETNTFMEGETKFKIKILAIHTSDSAANLITQLMLEACSKNRRLPKFIPEMMVRDLSKGTSKWHCKCIRPRLTTCLT